MKRVMIFLMFLILVSGMAYSETRTVYLIVPEDAGTLSYYAVDEYETEVTITASTETTSYLGNSNLKLVALDASTSDTFKLMAKYELNDKYYFLISSNTDTESDDNLEILETNFVSTNSPSEVYNEFGSFDDYPGIKIQDDVRLSMIPVTDEFTEFTDGIVDEVYLSDDDETYNNVAVNGYAGISPNNSTTFTIKEKDSETETVYTDLKTISDPITYSYTDDDGNDHYTVTVTYAQFRAKNTNSSTFTYDGKNDGNETYTLTGEMVLDLYAYNSGQGSYWMEIIPEGDTVVLIDDIGVTAEREIEATSKASDKSKSRDTNIKTSLIDSDNFIIKNIAE